MQIDEVEKIANHLGKTNGEVLTALGICLDGGGSGGPTFAGRSVPLVGRIDMDGTAVIDLEHPSRMVDAPGKVPPGTVAISAAEPTHSASTLLLGGLFFVKIVDTLVAAAIGRLSLVRLERGPWMLRTIKPSIEVDRYDLIGPSGVLEGQKVLCGSPVLLIRP